MHCIVELIEDSHLLWEMWETWFYVCLSVCLLARLSGKNLAERDKRVLPGIPIPQPGEVYYGRRGRGSA
jgi:hypothetical protein